MLILGSMLMSCTGYDNQTDVTIENTLDQASVEIGYQDYITRVQTIPAPPILGATMDIGYSHLQNDYVLLSYNSPGGDNRIPILFDQFLQPTKYLDQIKKGDCYKLIEPYQSTYLNICNKDVEYMPLLEYDQYIQASNHYNTQVRKLNRETIIESHLAALRTYQGNGKENNTRLEYKKAKLVMGDYSKPRAYSSPYPESNMTYLEKQELDNYISNTSNQ